MAFFRGDVYSYALDKMTPLNVYLPQDDIRRFEVNKPQKTLILLHGIEGNYSYWNRYTSVERYAQTQNIALVMPDAEMSMYANMKCGQRYADYIGKELPMLISDMFRINTDRSSLYIAGLSMGGYGALRFALSHPETFGKCASFSGALMLGSQKYLDEMKIYKEPSLSDSYIEMNEINRSLYHASKGAYGETFEYFKENDIVYLAKRALADNKTLPEILMTCGTEDFLYNTNLEYSKIFNELGIKHKFDSWSGVHNWLFWEESIKKYIDFFS